MASAIAGKPTEGTTFDVSVPDAAISDLVESVAQVSLQDTDTGDALTSKSDGMPPRRLRVYTRSQVMHLRNSPLVKPPEGMPSLKDWFGDWNEHQANAKKDNEAAVPTNGRDRRFRRDAEDSDPSRASFRSALSQPSQMGHFRHQTLRANDRDKDKDSERERERDLRDKEGQERLRNLSDKYDRDRLALSSSASVIRGKERDSAPHLSSNAQSRPGQAQSSTLASRRSEVREPSKRKIGESSEDWRRDAPRTGKDDRSDVSRRDRDIRERPRSRARESSRSRREPSARRDRDDREKERDKTRDRRVEDRDDPRRDKEDYPRRERDDHRREWDDFYNRSERDRDDHYPRGDRYRPRDVERDTDDDPRRWRDDGRREERLAGRRERDRDRWDRHEERDRERPSEDRDPRPRRGAPRERRVGGEEGKDREDRREREKEAEPAWMETYVPTTPSGGILGGRSADGELDGIQAWKKGMKEKERQEKESEASATAVKTSEDVQSAAASVFVQPSTAPEAQLDEIQLFKLMMKREAEKKESEQHTNASPIPASDHSFAANTINSPSQSVVDESQAIINRAHADGMSSTKSAAPPPDGSQSILSDLIAPTPIDSSSTSSVARCSLPDQAPERSRVLGSRAASTLHPPGVAATPSLSDPSSLDPPSSNASTPFNPPAGSRLLAFGSRPTSGPLGTDPIPPKGLTGLDPPVNHVPPPPGVSGLAPPRLSGNPPAPSNHNMLPDVMSVDPLYHPNGRHNPFDASRVQRSFSPHSSLSQTSGPYEELLEGAAFGQMADLRRASAVERAALGLPNDLGGPSYGDLVAGSSSSLDIVNGIPGGPNYATGKGSRFAKFFDPKPKDVPTMGRKGSVMGGFPSNAAMPDPRQGGVGLNGGLNGTGDTRSMEDIFAMLQNSAQNHRSSPQIASSGRIPSGGSQFAPNPPDLLQQQIHQQHFPQGNHLDSLYDSRMDDRFVPDGMVPGLRPAHPRSRSREPSGVLFNEQLDDPLHFNLRLQQQQQQQRGSLDQMYPGSLPTMYPQQQPGMLRNGGMPLQQQQFRGNPSPNQNSLGGSGQRLPPGLANLGGRPPHDPSQYLGGPMSGMAGGPQGGLHGGSSLPQGYNNLGGGGVSNAGLGGFGGPQIRGPAPQNPLGINGMANLGLQNHLDLRTGHQAQLLGMGGGGMGVGVGGGLRGQGPAFAPQHGPSGQLPSHIPMRQQQQQQLPSHLIPHMLPPHLQQQGLPGGNSQGTQDLMALLLGGHRE